MDTPVDPQGKASRTVGLDALEFDALRGRLFMIAYRLVGSASGAEDIVQDACLTRGNAWRDAPFYTEREQAALAWTEAVTRLDHGETPDEVYDFALQQFGEKGLVDLTLAITAINTWKRLNIAFRRPPEELWRRVNAAPAAPR